MFSYSTASDPLGWVKSDQHAHAPPRYVAAATQVVLLLQRERRIKVVTPHVFLYICGSMVSNFYAVGVPPLRWSEEGGIPI